jgi:hypothetical protein
MSASFCTARREGSRPKDEALSQDISPHSSVIAIQALGKSCKVLQALLYSITQPHLRSLSTDLYRFLRQTITSAVGPKRLSAKIFECGGVGEEKQKDELTL